MKATMVFFMICNIIFPAQLYNIHFLSSKFVYNKSLDFIVQYISIHIFCPSLLLAHFTFLFPCNIFISNLIFSLPTTCFHSTLLLFLPYPETQNEFPCQGSFYILFFFFILHPFAQILKYLHSLYTFNKLCQLVVGRVVVVAMFFHGYLQSFTNSVFQITNFTGSSPTLIFRLKF